MEPTTLTVDRPLARTHDAARVSPREGFFAHHGLWAPGIRLFRKLGFQAKALLITAAFVLPLLALLWAYWQTSQTTIDTARLERAGVAVVARIEPWLIAVQQQRRLVVSGAQAQVDLAGIEQALQAVQATVPTAPFDLALAEVLQPGLQADEALRKAAGSADAATLAAPLQAYVDAVAVLRTTVLDRSGLTLDPEQDTYYLMSVSTDAIARVVESISHARALAGAAEQRGSASPAELRELYAIWHTGREALGQVGAQIQRAGEHTAQVRERIRPDAANRAAAAFYTASAQDWFGDTFSAHRTALDVPGQAAVDSLRQLGADGLQLLDELLQARIDHTTAARHGMLGGIALSLLLAGYLFHSFYAVMQGGLAEVGRHLTAMTEGDLTTSPKPWGRDEAAQLMLLLAAMQDSLRGMVLQVRGASDGIVHSSTEIAEGAMDLSARTEQTAANLEESSAAMEQISATVRQTADHAKEAAGIAAHNAEVAARGGQVISNVVATMQGIQAAAGRIGDIIGVIDGIAFQTNILALNAAVEAARAGEQGRGFAVVAAEVRSLAKRSAEAASEIKSLISASVKQVDAGTTVVADAGRTIDEIVLTARRVHELLAQIAVGAQEQSQGVTQIGEAVHDLDEVTQQNAALVEETAAASSALKDQAHALAGQVARFRLPSGIAGG
ncbi:MAG: methyl-accepting chemotaxis protein [Burkholderiales bacterium]